MLVAGWAAGSAIASPNGATSSASGANLGGSTRGASNTSSSGAGKTANPGAGTTANPGAGTTAKSSPSAPTTPAAAASGKFKGTAVRTRYGSFQVEITVAAGKITDISMLRSGDQDATSQQITGYALPMLIQAVLKQQKADVGYVSGASYTTQGFEGAVQSAMQAAGLA